MLAISLLYIQYLFSIFSTAGGGVGCSSAADDTVGDVLMTYYYMYSYILNNNKVYSSM